MFKFKDVGEHPEDTVSQFVPDLPDAATITFFSRLVLNQADIMFFLVNLPESRFLTKQTIDRTIFELGDPMQRVRLAAPVSSADLQLDLVYSLHVGAPRHVRTSIFGVRLDDVENAQWLYHRNMQYVSCSPCQCKGLPEGVTAVLSLHQVKR